MCDSVFQTDWPNVSPTIFSGDIGFYSDIKGEVKGEDQNINTIINKSNIFPIPFGINTVKCQNLLAKGVSEKVLEDNINSVYPILHEVALPLFLDFLNHKRKLGSNVEREFYKDFTVSQLIDRLLLKRAVSFLGTADRFMLVDGFTGYGQWETIGTDKEKSPLILTNCLSYDEIKLSALLSVSSYTYFINDGSRLNLGQYCTNREELEETGIIIGLIGPRLVKPDVMEHQEIVITKQQNVNSKGYGRTSAATVAGIFSNFYEEPFLTYDEHRQSFGNHKKYAELFDDEYFNNNVYKKRLSLSFDTLLLEANERAQNCKQMAYVYVVGIGLGVWRISDHQNNMYLKTFCKRIKFLGNLLRNISDVCFSYVNTDSHCKFKDQDQVPLKQHPTGGIKIHIKNKNPHTKLTGSDSGKLLVVSYAWDGNALPGNEFWFGTLYTSGDPAAACSTQVAELHNCHINPKLSAANLRIATLKGVEKFSDYINKFKATQT